jgi:hypothetical protein
VIKISDKLLNEYKLAFKNSRECLIEMVNSNKKKSKATIKHQEKEFIILCLNDKELYETWISYAFALLKRQIKKPSKRLFRAWFNNVLNKNLLR